MPIIAFAGRCCTIVALALGTSALAAPASADPSTLIGTWRLISYIDTPEGGAPIRAFGERPIGLFVFTADGHVTINVMRNPPDMATPKDDIDPDACVPAWYCAYFGTYRIDSGQSQLVTRVLGGNIPTFLGTEQTRQFVITGDRLTFSAIYDANGRRVHSERILVRADAANRD